MDRGQAHALEGILAAVLLVLSLVFALQMSAVTPMTESSSNQHLENQQKAVGQDLLKVSAENGSLKTAVLYWNQTGRTYHDSGGNGIYHNQLPDQLRLGTTLENTFTDRGIAYNLRVNHLENGTVRSRAIVTQGEPSDNAVTVTETMTLYETDRFYHSNTTETETTLQEAPEDDFYIQNESNGPLYNVIEIELIIWRI